MLDRQTEAAIHADAQGLSERWAEGGLPALVLTIEDRLAGNVDDDAIYLLVDPMMQRIAGNLERWPSTVRAAERLVRAAGRAAPASRSLARVQRYDLPDGFHLLIGRDVQVRAQLRTLLTDALLWALVIVLAPWPPPARCWCAACSAAPWPTSPPPPRPSPPATSRSG